MKLLVGRFVLMGCISAVLVVANVAPEKPIESSPVTSPNISVVDLLTEKVIKSSPEINQRIELSETTSSPDKNSKIFNNPNVKENIEREIVVIHDQTSGGGGGGAHHDHGYHDHHDHHEHDHHHEHDYHHPPPARQPPPHHHHDHHHPPPPPPHHHHYPPPYPGYYPGYAPYPHHGMHQPYPAGGAAMPPPYPYYPPANYYNSPPKKSSATIIQTSSTTSGNGQNYPKPTDLINQGTEYLWNLFGKLGAITGENHHEVVLINPKPVASATPVQMLPPSWYANVNKGKINQNNDCNNKNE